MVCIDEEGKLRITRRFHESTAFNEIMRVAVLMFGGKLAFQVTGFRFAGDSECGRHIPYQQKGEPLTEKRKKHKQTEEEQRVSGPSFGYIYVMEKVC